MRWEQQFLKPATRGHQPTLTGKAFSSTMLLRSQGKIRMQKDLRLPHTVLDRKPIRDSMLQTPRKTPTILLLLIQSQKEDKSKIAAIPFESAVLSPFMVDCSTTEQYNVWLSRKS
jgi:hypothetical protein